VLMRISKGMEIKSIEVLMLPYADDVYIGNCHKYLGVGVPADRLGRPGRRRGTDGGSLQARGRER
jgi:hypothetical protein